MTQWLTNVQQEADKTNNLLLRGNLLILH